MLDYSVYNKAIVMKPYKLIKSKNPRTKKAKIIHKLKPPNVPLKFFKNVHPPKRVIVSYEGQKYEVAPSDVSMDDNSMNLEDIKKQTDHQQNLVFRHPDL